MLLSLVGEAGVEVQRLDLLARPWSATQKLQARLDARVFLETVDIDPAAEPLPAVMIDEAG
jgi:hypothetical protein